MKWTALVVDDSKISRMIHQKLLDAMGIENRAAENGAEAVEVHRSGKNFDLILIDRDMPILNGVEATKKLRSMGVRSTIAGVSSHLMGKEQQEFMEAGLDHYYEKPLSVDKLLCLLRQIGFSGSELH